MPPAKEDTGNVQAPRLSPRRVITSTTPAEAPEERPNRKGSAKSLRVVVCNSAPTNARPAPASSPSKVRGKRSSSTMLLIMGGTSPGTMPSALNTWARESDTLPWATLAKINPANNSGARVQASLKRIFSDIS
ncbi:hypothetical protein D3C80_1457540 [compost metagenome]